MSPAEKKLLMTMSEFCKAILEKRIRDLKTELFATTGVTSFETISKEIEETEDNLETLNKLIATANDEGQYSLEASYLNPDHLI
jgi:hypothetical protein